MIHLLYIQVVAALLSAALKDYGMARILNPSHLSATLMFHLAMATLFSLASVAFAIPTLYLVGDSTMAKLGKNHIEGYVIPMRPCVNQ